MKLNIIEDLDQNNLILEGTRYDKQASKILSDSGLFDSETADAIIDGLGGMKTILPAIAALLTNVFSGQIANGMINFATTIKSLSPKVAAQNDSDRAAFLESSARLMAGLSEK